jgi:coenzyme Q-binding protein COQ10
MPQHFEKQFVPFTPRQMFDLVAAIENYPSFLPWCLQAVVSERTETSAKAVLTVGARAFRERFTSFVTFDAPRTIKVRYGDGPLSHLENSWIFHEAEGGCVIEFFVDFHFRSRLLGSMMDLFFDKAFKKIVESFKKKAEELYGKEGRSDA